MFRLKELRLENAIKRSKLAEDLQMNAGTIANYENELRQAPYEYLIKFAEYFDVSVDYLLGVGEKESVKKSSALSAEENEFLEGYRKLSRLGKSRVLEYIEMWNDRT